MATLAEQWDMDVDPKLKGLNPDLADRVQQAQDAYRTKYGKELPITSGFRTTEQQAQLASKPNPYPVAKAGTSLHETGNAIDIDKNVPNEFLQQFGLHRPLGAKDPVHTTLMPQKTASFADLWESTPEPTGQVSKQPSEQSKTSKTALETAFELKKQVPGFLASTADVLASAPSAIASTAGYVVPRALGGISRMLGGRAESQLTPEEITQGASRVAGQLAQPVGRATGLAETQGYKQALPTQILETVGKYIGDSAENISKKTGIPVQDVEQAINLYIVALGATGATGIPLAKQKFKQGVQAFKEAKAELTPSVQEMQAQFQAKQAGMQSGGAAVAGNKSTLDAAIAQASPELKASLKKIAPNDLNPEVLNRHLEADDLPIPIRLTKGQATQNPSLISKERNERGIKEEFVTHLNQQNKDLLENANEIKRQTAPNTHTTDYIDDASNLIDIGKKIKEQNVKKTQDAYKELEQKAGGKFPIDSKTFAENSLKALSVADDIDFLPDTFVKRLEKYASGEKTMNFNNFEHLRTQIGKAVRSTDDGNVTHALGIMRTELENLPLLGETAELKAYADKARSTAKADFDLEKSNDLYKKIVNKKADTKDFIQNFVIRSKNNDFANTMQLLAGDEQALGHLRKGTMDYLIRESTDASGNFKTGRFNELVNTMDLNGKLLPLFGDQTPYIRNLVKTGQYIEARPRGSYVNESNSTVQAIKSFAAGALEKTGNVAGGGIVPLGSMAREGIQRRAIKKEVNESLKPGAGTKLSDIGK